MDIQRDGDVFQFRPVLGEEVVVERALDARAQSLAERQLLEDLQALGMLVVHYETRRLSRTDAANLAGILVVFSECTAYDIEEATFKVAPRRRAAWGAIAAEVAGQINEAVGGTEEQHTHIE